MEEKRKAQEARLPAEALEVARKAIDRQDQIILQAFQERMKAAGKIAEIKEEQGLPVYVPQREKEILEQVSQSVPAELAGYAERLFETLMELSREYQRKDRHYGLLGRTLGHSFSPEIHRMLGQWSEPYDYQIFQVEPEDLRAFLYSGCWNGLNVTIPYKREVMKYCDEISPEAERIGAVNTLVRRGGKIFGYNTDYFGFRKLAEESGVRINGEKCVVLGSGGASKTVVTVLEDLGASQVVVASRGGKYGCDYSQLKDHYDAAILVNTTPVGMYPETGKSAVYPGNFIGLKHVFDLIYNPLRTSLLCQAKRAAMGTTDGLLMLVAQAKASSQLFLGGEIDDEAVYQIEKQIRKEKENIVLIGMPGSGKSTVGQALAGKTGKEFIDTDSLIVEKAGKSIPDIFREEGEEAFRLLEMEVIETLRHKTGAVIACGGGVVMREENYYALAENGRLIFLNRPIDLLPTEGRPVSQSVPLNRLYAARLPLYRSWCDEEVNADRKTIEEIVETIE